MAIKFNIATTNTCTAGGGWHELHDVRFLSSEDHALDTLKSILFLNNVYKEDSTLENVYIECTDAKTVTKFKEYLILRNIKHCVEFVREL